MLQQNSLTLSDSITLNGKVELNLLNITYNNNNKKKNSVPDLESFNLCPELADEEFTRYPERMFPIFKVLPCLEEVPLSSPIALEEQLLALLPEFINFFKRFGYLSRTAKNSLVNCSRRSTVTVGST